MTNGNKSISSSISQKNDCQGMFPVLTNIDGSIVVEPFSFKLRETETNLFIPATTTTISVRERIHLLQEQTNSKNESKWKNHNNNNKNNNSNNNERKYSTNYATNTAPRHQILTTEESPVRTILRSFASKENRKEILWKDEVRNKKVGKVLDHSTTVSKSKTNDDKTNVICVSINKPDTETVAPVTVMQIKKETVVEEMVPAPNKIENNSTIVERVQTTIETCQNNTNQENVIVVVDEKKPIVIVLISKQPMKREIATMQQKSLTVLDSYKIPYMIVDGADTKQNKIRNELFDVSGLRGKYPQYFVRTNHGTIRFWGDWDTFEYANENGTIYNELLSLLSTTTTTSTMNDSSNLVPAKTPPQEQHSVDEQNNQLDTTATTNTTTTVIVLISKLSLKREIASIQEKAMTILNMYKIPYSIVDGADPKQKNVRNELFDVSGLRGTYPQFFLLRTSCTDNSNNENNNNHTNGQEQQQQQEHEPRVSFWGDWDTFVYANDNGTIAQELGIINDTLE